MCIYVATPLSESAAMLVIMRPPGMAIPENSTGLTHIKTGTATFFDEAYGHMNGANYTSPDANMIQNMVYASNGNHPSNIIAAMNNGVRVFMDQVTLIGSAATSNYAKVPETNIHSKEYVKRGYAGDGGGHVFGWGTCQWLRKCDQPGEIEGSSCSATLSNVFYKGYCFTSDTGSLECGRLAATDDEYGENPVAFEGSISPNLLPSVSGDVDVEGAAPSTTTIDSTPGASLAVYRCPTGSPAKTLGSFVSKRMLSAGCMISSDANYDELAEVHVPAYCATPAIYMMGCLLPSAVNYDPAAKMVGLCSFPTKGCMDSMSVNFNPLATMTDTDKPCIPRVVGCTVQSTASSPTYTGVDSNTPAYKSGFYGSGFQGAGGQNYIAVPESVYQGPMVTNYNPAANVNSGCVVAVEGCMDPTARNYDPLATVNSYTWCVPSVPGCMVPNEFYVGASYSNPQTTSTFLGGTVDSPTSFFSATTTLHVPSMCINGRRGCMLDKARNYDSLATINTTCYGRRKGCLNPGAVNYGCPPPKDMYDAPCAFTGMFAVTRHVVRFCRWTNESPPPSPPPPPRPPADDYVLTYTTGLEMEVEGTLEGLQALEADFAAVFRSISGLAEDYPVTVTITELDRRRNLKDGRRALQDSSGHVDMEASFDDESAAQAASTAMVAEVGTTSASAQSAFASTGVTVLSAPTHTQEVSAEEIVDDSDASAGLIGGIVGGIGGLLMLIGIAAFFYQRRRKKTFAA